MHEEEESSKSEAEFAEEQVQQENRRPYIHNDAYRL